ncbi:YggS family pyridoxal phosphate-dependent enzyme [bacterium]|nr:YggS family pyridoxal phosphate-dependent enzyme [bacterium]
MIHSISSSLSTLRADIKCLAADAALQKNTPRLMAVSKTNPAESILEALQAGQRLFGENKVQEAAAKFPALRQQYPDLELHLIGPLQRNKVKDALATFDIIQSLDRPELAEELAKHWNLQTRLTQSLFIQVNTGKEPQKAGIPPEETIAFTQWARREKNLPVTGLMAIPPAHENPSSHFAWLYQCQQQLGLPELSIGMSGDYPAAIRYGATIIRVGTAIFGERGGAAPTPPPKV